MAIGTTIFSMIRDWYLGTSKLPVSVSSGVLSTSNSSTASLATGNTFTGTYENILSYNEISVTALTSQNTTLYVDFSTDGVNTVRTVTYTLTANRAAAHKLARVAQYARLRIANSSGATSTVTLQTIFSGAPKSHLSTNLSADIDDYSDAEVTRSILVGRKDGGDIQ